MDKRIELLVATLAPVVLVALMALVIRMAENA